MVLLRSIVDWSEPVEDSLLLFLMLKIRRSQKLILTLNVALSLAQSKKMLMVKWLGLSA